MQARPSPAGSPATKTDRQTDRHTHTHTHTQSYLRAEHNMVWLQHAYQWLPRGRNNRNRGTGWPGQEPPAHRTRTLASRHLPSTLQQGPGDSWLLFLPARPPGSPPGSSRRRAGGQAAVTGAAPGGRVKQLPSPDRAPLCQQSYLWTYPSSPGEQYLLGKAEPNDQVPPRTSR